MPGGFRDMQDRRASKLDPQPVPRHPHPGRQFPIHHRVIVFMTQVGQPGLPRFHPADRFQRLTQ